jgi:prevent-host-death family protein
MPAFYTIQTTQQKFSAVVDEVADHPVTITKQGRAVAVQISMERMEVIAETMELLADSKAMSAIRKHRSGEAKLRVFYKKASPYSTKISVNDWW